MFVAGEIMDCTSTYFQEALTDDTESFIDRAREALKPVQYDTLVGTGMSGALVVPMLARALGKTWIVIRKPGEQSHEWRLLIGKLGRRWVFVDDFIDSGSTRKRVRGVIKEETTAVGFETTYVGDYLYVDYPHKFQPARKPRSSNYLKSAYKSSAPSSLAAIIPPPSMLTEDEEKWLFNTS